MYYNTNNETGETLTRSRNNTVTQEDVILGIFEHSPTNEFTPSEVLNVIGFQDPDCRWPITSIRRAITNLTDSNKIKKTDNQKVGPYGKNVYTWKLI